MLYPFGRQSFGWLEQRAALDNVRRMVEQVQLRYHIDSRRVYLGGMSNGARRHFGTPASRRPASRGSMPFRRSQLVRWGP
ncbi:hypothetical protein [Hymenobacter cellulosilyticus]|uniref:Peptidase S9 prolyl oligopeptidase catalytic domain-containing protein n=1 Tax=Hymenobacter cellulosilyticus TaxID=2932248 RepID=A0A8T9Q3L8_9BACT|nr:hypothetical protein [Hymenobacter cellulosilyticus]UOQ70468.1 hypothetical protein MUN79_17230 [Hymenobacter cellulosilyticus]